MESRPKINWKVVHELEEEGVLVQVSASDSRRPRYTIRIGRRGESGVISYLQAFVEGQGSVRVRSLIPVVTRLLTAAEDFVQIEAQRVEDEWIAEQIARDERGVQRDGKKRPPRAGYRDHSGSRRSY